eukprot:9043352-Pyramimonas_sp.AAC.1
MGWARADEEDEPHISYGSAVRGNTRNIDQQVMWYYVPGFKRDDDRQGLSHAVLTSCPTARYNGRNRIEGERLRRHNRCSVFTARQRVHEQWNDLKHMKWVEEKCDDT